jgi:hypothetical protein
MKRLIAFAAGFLMVGSLMAQVNTTAGTAAFVQWGQKVWSVVNGATPTQFWFRAHVETPRSYCVETAQPQNATFGDKRLDTVLDIFGGDSTTLLVSGDETNSNEPKTHDLSRACWVTTAGGTDNYFKVTPFNAGVASQAVELRFVETTLFCPWFFVAGDYNAFSLIRNTSNTSLSGIVVTWRGLTGTVGGTTTISIPANGTAILNARDFVDPLVFSNGSVEIAHAGSPQQLQGSTTTLSGTTGLGFDALFTQRQTW